ncbi:PIN domain-containing protein [Hyphomonas sp. NPDC076900]|uniref:PIN domain-containing protein n=1 Tax=unclassified Hyphomonas TaxID=2630699 RepID=UPI003D08AD56
MAVFLDTNILIYSISTSEEPLEFTKKSLAADLLQRRNDLVLSTQVLQEFYVQATRASRPGALPHELACEFIESWKRFQIVPVTADLVDRALLIRRETGFQYWDCAIIAAAQIADCDTLLTEDMQEGRILGGVTLFNPFSILRTA